MRKNFRFKRLLTLVIAAMMLVTAMPVGLLAQNEPVKPADYNNVGTEQINKSGLDVKVAKPAEGQTAADLIKNPDQPAIYTYRTDYKVQNGDKYVIDYQPYIASVGDDEYTYTNEKGEEQKVMTAEEKAKVNKTIKLPDLTGYEKPDDDYKIDYDTVKNSANGNNKTGNDTNGIRYQANKDFKYKAKSNTITIKHVFQDLEDFTKYTNPDGSVGEEGQLITTQNGNTGSTMEVSPLDGKHPNRKGFVPEAPSIIMQVPENADNFILEYRYNRAHYDVNFDTKGGTALPNRTLYYDQTIPKIDDKSIPTKAGCDFLGWKPSHDLQTTDGKTYLENQIIKDSKGNPILNLAADLKMPASEITFTAVWKDKPKAEYAIQFWTEKTDYNDKDNNLPLRERYDFIGARRVDNADTGSTPNLTNLDIHGITFPDLNGGRLEKAQNDSKEFARYYFLNEALTKKQNASEKDPTVQKSVLSNGETVYNVYYDRRVYTLYFTSINDYNDDYAYWPIITKDGQVLGKEGAPYKVDVRFNQSLDKIWPKDEEISGLPKSYVSDSVGDDGLIGWMINHNNNDNGVLIFRDTPPYRLSAEDFIDAKDVMSTEDESGGKGHADKIPIGDNKTKDRGEYEISLGASYIDTAIAYHIDIIKDDFEGKEQIDYDMTYWKSDTNTYDYEFILPHLQGFTLKKETRPAILIGKVKNSDVEKTFDELNAERNKKTPFRSDDDKIEYISHFPWSEKLFDGTNAYDYANYYRNNYKLKLNNDPKTVKNDSEYGEGNILEVPYEYPLKDLKLDTAHKPKKPNWVPEDWDFLGWALDPAGENLVKDGNETKLHYDQVLYAKWGEPDYKWKVIFDPNGGSLRTIDENNLTTERKTVKEGDIGQEIETTYPIKESNDGNKQVFKVFHKQKLVEPSFKPVRKGYDFMGWEIIRYKKDATTGDYTDVIDTSYRDTYKVPELYSFGNDVVSPIYLKAIWVPNNRVDVKVEHYILDKNYKQVKKLEDTLENKRSGYFVATTGDKQDDKYTLVPHDELDEKLTGNLKTIYEEYNNRVKLNNSFFQTFRVEPAEIPDPEDSEKMIPNPNVKNNVFKFFYRPYRHREYKVNYIDEQFKDNPEEGKIIDQELVTNGNRHYDARNYRVIPGWVLTSAPQQQLFFDVDEDTNQLLGINGTGKDEITFYYKDVRVIEVPKDGKTPDGYVRVTFKADKGGSFGKDAEGKDITELHYDVIKGLKSDLLPVPGDPVEEDKKEKDKYYITPDDGKKFTKWDKSPLLNKNTIINEAHTFTAYFEWSGLSAKGLVRTEAFKDPSGKWTNDFAPTIKQLKAQLVWREKDEVKDLPAGTEIELYDEDGTELTTDEQVYELVKEQNKADKDELVRTVNVKAKVTFPDGKEPQELDIPITVYKNVYEALNKAGDKPLFLSEAEKKDSKDGGLKEILKDNTENRYIKVTIKPNKDFTNKDDKVYYVNPNAWVEIPELKVEDSEAAGTGFINWTADKENQNEDSKANGKFDFKKRHKFTEDTVISPRNSNDVVEQEDPNKKPDVPDTFVKVIVNTTDKATDETAFEKTFWVNPTKEVAIPVKEPKGKENQEVEITGLGKKNVNYIFKEWQKVQTGETDDSLTKVDPAVKIDLAKNQYTDKVTVIEAAYKKSIQAEPIVNPLKTTKLDTPQGKEITNDDLIKQITPQEGKEIESIEVISKPDGNTVGNEPAKVIVKYKDGTTQGTNDKPVVIPVEVHKNIIPEAPGGQRPKDALDNYVKVIFKAGEGGTLSGDTVYYVSPEVEIDMTSQAEAVSKNPSIGYTANGGSWSPEIKAEKITEEKTYEFNFVKSKDIVEKTDDPNQEIPKGYVKVTFKTEDAKKGTVAGANEKIYYVNPKAGIKLKVLEEDQTAGEKELAVPKTAPAANYEFDKWFEEIDTETTITSERIHVAKFKSAKVTLTYEAGEGATGEVPAEVKVDHGTKVRLARPDGLSKDNATFAGWKIGEKTYQAGDEITLNENTTATAQWSSAKHTVTFNSMGGSDVPSQTVDHGKTATEPTPAPTLDGKVFMGWKEKESDTNYFDFANTAITEDKTLIAIWEKPVQNIDEKETVDTNKFIKVIFKEGKHGKLTLEGIDQTNPVAYKVAKDYDFNTAKINGLVVPKAIADTYYKLLDANNGWDKELKFEDNQAVYTFTAQYAPIADVIPIDPTVTPDDKLQEDKPDNMVLVTFEVDEDKAYMEGITKYYVKKNTEVDVPSPIVFNKISDNEFKGWVFNNEVTMKIKGSFSQDTVISDKVLEKATIHIEVPTAGADLVKIEDITDGAKAKLEVISNGQSKVYDDSMVRVKVRQGRKFINVEIHGFKLDKPLQSGDLINFWAINDNGESEVYKYIIE